MKNIVTGTVLLFSLLIPQNALASGTRKISTSDAQGLNGQTIELEIPFGYDLTVDFLELEETIVDAAPGDPSSFVFNGLVGKICPKFISTPCEGSGSKVISIRQIEPIEFPNIPSSADGSTTLTLVTQSQSGFKVYKFILRKGQGEPAFDHLKIVPDTDETPITNDSIDDAELKKFRERIQNTDSQI